jgi:hypothetical protein
MDEILAQLFPQAPSYFPGLLGQEQANLLQQQAQRQGLLGIGMGLLQAAAPSTTRPSLGAGIAQGLATGQQMAQNVYVQRLQEQQIAQQLAEQQRALQEQQAARAILPQIMRQGQAQPTLYGQPSAFPLRDDEGNVMPGAGVSQGAPSLDLNAALRLLTEAPSVAAKVLPTVQQFQKLGQPERVTLSEGQQVFQMTPQGFMPIAGAPKTEKPAASVLEAMQVLGINIPVNELSQPQRERIENYIDRKAERLAPKVAVDLKDPSAVAKAQSGIVGDWRGVQKDFGAADVSTRYLAAVDAVLKGNAGNKAADGALVYAIAKIYDPAGAVQEGDKSTIIGSRSVPETVKGYVQKLINGQSFLPQERANLLEIVSQQVRDRAAVLEQERRPYVEISKSLGGTGELLTNPLLEVLKKAEAGVQSASATSGGAFSVDALKAVADAELRKRRGQ